MGSFPSIQFLFFLFFLAQPRNILAQNQNIGNESKEFHFASIFLVMNIVGLVVIIFLFIVYYRKNKRLNELMKRKGFVQEDIDKVEREAGVEVGETSKKMITFGDTDVRFELDHLLKASAEGLGQGNFGNSYKAVLDGGLAVAVKRLRDLKPLSEDEFSKQLKMIAGLKHPNLLELLAYHFSKEEKLLVYRFASHGSVYNRLHGERGTTARIPFRWGPRLSVARGVARAMEYLHHVTKPQAVVPHGNLKSTNVLLDENDAVLVCDYGFSSFIAAPLAAQRLAAYKSPEYIASKKVSKKSDVWTYGCFLLELVTGRMSPHTAARGVKRVDLCSWIHRAVREEWTAEIFDGEILRQRSASDAMLTLLQIAMKCCDKSPEKRPEMGAVVREVENIKVVEDSEDDELSIDRSLTDDSMSATPSMVMTSEHKLTPFASIDDASK